MSLIPIASSQQIGQLIKQVRKQQGIRQDDLAMIIGRSHVNVRDIERGKPTVAIGTVLQLLDELGIRLYLEAPES